MMDRRARFEGSDRVANDRGCGTLLAECLECLRSNAQGGALGPAADAPPIAHRTTGSPLRFAVASGFVKNPGEQCLLRRRPDWRSILMATFQIEERERVVEVTAHRLDDGHDHPIRRRFRFPHGVVEERSSGGITERKAQRLVAVQSKTQRIEERVAGFGDHAMFYREGVRGTILVCDLSDGTGVVRVHHGQSRQDVRSNEGGHAARACQRSSSSLRAFQRMAQIEDVVVTHACIRVGPRPQQPTALVNSLIALRLELPKCRVEPREVTQCEGKPDFTGENLSLRRPRSRRDLGQQPHRCRDGGLSSRQRTNVGQYLR